MALPLDDSDPFGIQHLPIEPSDPLGIYIPLLLFLLFLSAFFSGAEVALVSLSPAKSRTLLQQKRKGSKDLIFLKEHPERLLITILVGNNIVNILIPVLSTLLFTKIFGAQILGVLTGILTLILLLFGEILPKTFAQKHSEAAGLFAAPIVYWMGRILFPLLFVLEKIIALLNQNNEHEKHFSDQELIALTEIGEEEGELHSSEKSRIKSVLEFRETTVEEVMTPRPEMDALPDTASLAEAEQFFLEKTHSRIPVFCETIDNITGIITLKHILEFQQNTPQDTFLKDLPLNPIITVPVSMPLEEVLKEMKWKRSHMAIVIDEHGGTAGIATLEDLLEEVFGEIEDETDAREMEIKKMPDGSYLLSGSLELEHIREKTGVTLDGDDNDRISRIILESLGRFPKRGEEIILAPKVTVIIEKMEKHKIHSLRLFS